MKSTELQMVKSRYMDGEILTLTINGGLGRGVPIYSSSDEKDRETFRLHIRKKLKEYALLYKHGMNGERHTENVKRFAEDVSKNFKHILIGGRLRIGRAQKLLNLYLKYRWTMNLIEAPPHCPFDSLIIGRMKGDVRGIAWSGIEDIEDYKKLVEVARKAKDADETIAEWELRVWNEINGKDY